MSAKTPTLYERMQRIFMADDNFAPFDLDIEFRSEIKRRKLEGTMIAVFYIVIHGSVAVTIYPDGSVIGSRWLADLIISRQEGKTIGIIDNPTESK